jgi:hypothetical protein
MKNSSQNIWIFEKSWEKAIMSRSMHLRRLSVA